MELSQTYANVSIDPENISFSAVLPWESISLLDAAELFSSMSTTSAMEVNGDLLVMGFHQGKIYLLKLGNYDINTPAIDASAVCIDEITHKKIKFHLDHLLRTALDNRKRYEK